MAKRSALYTRTGDAGMTSLVGGQRVSKASTRLESYGAIDELNSFIGVLLAQLPQNNTLDKETLLGIQHKLFSIGAYLATDFSEPMDFTIESGITTTVIARIEKEIDRLDAAVPRLKAFILPSGGPSTAAAHVCRVVARRAERRIYALMEEGVEIETEVLRYVNRLSDYFFILARNLAHAEGGSDVIWSPSCD